MTLDEVYDRVYAKIEDGSASTADFNLLIKEASAKSAKERTLRHLRQRKVTPRGTSPTGQVVPKHKGRNDPPRQSRGRRYAAGTPAKEKQNKKQEDDWANMSEDIIAFFIANETVKEGVLKEGQRPDAVIVATAARLLRDVNFRAIFESRYALPGDGSHKLDDAWLYDIVMAGGAIIQEDIATKKGNEYGLWQYRCPHCHGTNAYNGNPDTGMKFRGGAKCQDCGKGFSVVHQKHLLISTGSGYKCNSCDKESGEAGQDSCPFCSSGRLIKQVIMIPRTIQDMACPHCNETIPERGGLSYDGGQWFHRPCRDKGPIELPAANHDDLTPEWRGLVQGRTEGGAVS